MPRKKGSVSTQNKSGIKTTKYIEQPKVIKTISCDEEQEMLIKKPYQCVTCGKRYATQKNNFAYSQSPLYNGNNNFLPTCNHCLDNLVEQYTLLLGDPNEAIKRICLHYDIYIKESLLNSCKKKDLNQSRIRNYIRHCNLQQYAGKTYDTYLSEVNGIAINNEEDLEQLKSEGKSSPTKVAVERWGLGVFGSEDYPILEEHYKMLKSKNQNADHNQEIFIKALCTTKLLQKKAIKEKRYDDYEKFTKLYRDTFKQAGLKTVQEIDNSAEETLGVTLATISQYTPEEYYRDKELYKDFDGLGDYIKRFILRPIKNLVLGTNERDKTYCVKDDGENG